MKPPADVVRSQSGLHGHLELVCAAGRDGVSYLSQQSFSAPVHLSKPHCSAGTLVVNIVNPTAGLLAGDRVRMSVCVKEGARLLLTTPSATRVHQMHGGSARVEQEFHVATGGWLENWPELLIPQGGARYDQSTRITVEPGGELLFFEVLAPGRVAAGEVFSFECLDWATDIFAGDRLVVRERFRIAPASGSLEALRARFPTAYYASCFVISSRLTADSPCWPRIHGLHDDEAWIGWSALVAGGWTVKLVAAGSIPLRQKLGAIRREIFAALGASPPSLRRAGWDD